MRRARTVPIKMEVYGTPDTASTSMFKVELVVCGVHWKVYDLSSFVSSESSTGLPSANGTGEPAKDGRIMYEEFWFKKGVVEK